MDMADKLFKIPNPLNYQGNAVNWKKFKQQFDIYMKVSGLDKSDSESKVNILLNVGGEEALEIIENLNLTPEEKKDYDSVIQAFNNHCTSQHNEIYKSYKFFTRVQEPSEIFMDFYNDLLVMAGFCNFGNQRNRLIRDRIIVGIRSQELQEQFLKSPDLTLDELVKICLEHEVGTVNRTHCKYENEASNDIERNVDKESNNNYDELSNLDDSEGNLNKLDQIPISNEILFHDMESEEGFVDDMELMEFQSEMDDPDYKPFGLSLSNEKKRCSKRKRLPVSNDGLPQYNLTTADMEEENDIETTSLRKYLKKTNIQNEIVEVIEKHNNVIKIQSDVKSLRGRKKGSKNSIKTECKKEASEESDDNFLERYSIPIEDQDEYSQIDENSEILNECPQNSQIDRNSEILNQCPENSQVTYGNTFLIEYENLEDQDESPDKGSDNAAIIQLIEEDTDIDNEDSQAAANNSILIEYENVSEDPDEYSQISDEGSEQSSSINGEEEKLVIINEQKHLVCEKSDGFAGMMNEMAEAEYLLEKNTNVSPKKRTKQRTKLTRKRGRKPTKGHALLEPKIIEVTRDNLPPLILKSFRKKTLLLGKMPFACKKCDATFWTQFQLEKHQLVHVLKKVSSQSKPPSKIFKCEECGKEFKKICDLERHTRVHTGEKPSVCNICNKRFQQPYNLNKHLHTHTQEKNFECVICQKKFGRNDVLNRHVLTHSMVKPFKCHVCQRTFIRSSQLKLHLKKHHDLEYTEGDPENRINNADEVEINNPDDPGMMIDDEVVASASTDEVIETKTVLET